MQLLTIKYRVLPTKKQHRGLAGILEAQRRLYNDALRDRRDYHAAHGRRCSYIDQTAMLTKWRLFDVNEARLPVNLHRWTLKRVDDACAAFESGEGRGRPRFRSRGRWRSFGLRTFVGARLDGKSIRLKGLLGALRVHMHRPLPDGATIRSCVFTKGVKGWSICLQVRADTPDKRAISSAVGIDVGIKALAATSDGLLIPNPRAARRAEKKMRIRQRALSRCKKGSKRRQKVRAQAARLHAKIANTRSTALHQVSAMLTAKYDLIAVEALNVKGLVKGRQARNIYDAGWSKLKDLLRYKAERAGAHFIEVNPKFTSQTCPECGSVAKKTLKERTHSCACGCVIDRDVAAAQIILSRAVMGPGQPNVARWGERAVGNIAHVDSSPALHMLPATEGI